MKIENAIFQGLESCRKDSLQRGYGKVFFERIQKDSKVDVA